MPRGALPPRQAEMRQERELVTRLLLSASIFQSGSPPIVTTLELHLMRWIQGGAPCDSMRRSPHQLISGRDRAQPRSLMQHCEDGRGLQGGWDPSLRRRLAATPPGGHASTLDWYYFSSVFTTPCSDQPFSAAAVGTTPVSRYRHSATKSLRATATMAMRRMRPLAVPTRSRNQVLKGLLGW